jgi:hypothetical protein
MSHFQKLVATSLLFNIFLQSCHSGSSQLRDCNQAELGIHKDQSLQGTSYGPASINEHASGTHRDRENGYLMLRFDSLSGASHDNAKPAVSDLSSDTAPLISCEPAPLPKASPEFSIGQLGHIVLGKDALETRVPLCSPPHVLSEASSVVSTTDDDYGPFILPFDNEVTFSRERGEWQAIVKNNWLAREELFPVVCAGDVAAILSDLQDARAVDVLHRIHIQKPDHTSKCVYVGALGVKGGMAKKKKKKTKPSPRLSDDAALDAESASTSHVCLISFDLEWLLHRIEVYRCYVLDCGVVQYDLASEYLEKGGIYDSAQKYAFLQDVQMARYSYEHFIYQLYQSIDSLRHDPSTIADILLWLLRCRDEYLLNREEKIQRWLIWDYQSSASIVPTDTFLFGIQTINSKEEQEVNNLSREISVQTFELQNELICSLFFLYKGKLGNQKPDQVISKLLTDATQLHPLLEGKVSKLGHPDQCTYLHKFAVLLQEVAPMLLDKMIRIKDIKDAGKRADRSKKLLREVFEKMFDKKKLQERYNEQEDDSSMQLDSFIDILIAGCVDRNSGNVVATILLRVIHNHTDCFSAKASRVWEEAKSEFEPYTETSESTEPGESLLPNFLKPNESIVDTESTA